MAALPAPDKSPADPAQMSGPRRRLRLKPLGQIAVKTCRKALAKRGAAIADLVDAWPQIVGSAIASHSHPTALNRASKTLTVRVEGGRALELQHCEREVIDRISTYCGSASVNRIKIVQGPLQARARAKPRAITHELTKAEHDSIAAKTAAIKDERLRTALLRLGERIAQTAGTRAAATHSRPSHD